jgi:hypothetical protein
MARESESDGGDRRTRVGVSDPPGHEQRCVFVANVTTDGAERTCTISPLPTSEYRLDAEWVAARRDSFVSLEETR